MIENRFTRWPGSSFSAVGKLSQACVPYQLNQSGRKSQSVTITSIPYAIRNNAIGTGDCFRKKNSFQSRANDRRVTSDPPAVPHSQAGCVTAKVRERMCDPNDGR